MNYTTESPHPKTMRLSQIFSENIQKAMELLLSIEKDLILPFQEFEKKARRILLAERQHLVLVGSGSSGRIAKILAHRFPELHGYIAGGDISIIKPQEGFEDSEKDGAKFVRYHCSQNDILLLISASGSAKFNYGAAKEAAQKTIKTYYFYNNENDPEILQELIKNQEIIPLKFVSGPQAIAGSTRLQAANLALLCLGSLFCEPSANLLAKNLEHVNRILLSKDFLDLYQRIESEGMLSDRFLTYITNKELFLTVFADISELSPTFGENIISQDGESQLDARIRAYLKNGDASEIIKSPKYKLVIDDIEMKRRPGIFIEIDSDYSNIYFITAGMKFIFPKFQPANAISIFDLYNLKLTLNLISNSLMIRAGKVHGNIMTYVRPSNLKLKARVKNILATLLIQENRADLIEKIPRILEEIYIAQKNISPVPLAFLMLTKNYTIAEAEIYINLQEGEVFDTQTST
jgi:N-acetylmuramic acid 6-phosphate (MurNAc-6-P) etherase